MSKKRGLGRGLGALIPDERPEKSEAAALQELPVRRISPNPHQPRSAMDDQQLAELAASIEEHGVIQPLIVTAGGDDYVLIAGERRWRAAQLAGLQTVPVVLMEATPQAMLELALIENVQRADLNALEEAAAYRQLMDDFGLTQEEVAARVGKGRSTIANLVRILTLPEEVQQAVLDGGLTAAHAREILRLPTPEMQINATRQVTRLELSRRQTKTLVDNLLSEKKPAPRPRPAVPAELKALQTEFEQRLGTRVNIEKGRRGGKVVIYYYSDEELQAIYDAIVDEPE